MRKSRVIRVLADLALCDCDAERDRRVIAGLHRGLITAWPRAHLLQVASISMDRAGAICLDP